MQPQPSHPNHRLPPAPLCILRTSHPSVSLSVDQSLTTGSKGIYNPALSKHIAAHTFYTRPSSQYQTISMRWIFYGQYLASLHYLNPGRQKSSVSFRSTWRTRLFILGVAVLELFIRGSISKYSAQALNNSCLASVFIGAGSRGVICHYGELWFN